MHANGSTTSANSVGERGHPWHVPLCTTNTSDMHRAVRSFARATKYKRATHLSHPEPKFILCITALKYLQSRVMNALRRSMDSPSSIGWYFAGVSSKILNSHLMLKEVLRWGNKAILVMVDQCGQVWQQAVGQCFATHFVIHI